MIKKCISFLLNFLKNKSAQSLIEVLVGLAIGAILIGGASAGLVFILRSSKTVQSNAVATRLTQNILNLAQTFALMDWWNFTNLSRDPSYYFFAPSLSSSIPVLGKEVVLGKDVKNGLVGYWGFNEDSGLTTFDLSGMNNNGVFSGNISRVSNCPFYKCILSDGGSGSNVSFGSSSVFDTNSFSISLWLKPVSLKTNISGPNGNVFLGREVYGSAGFRMGISGTSPQGKVFFWTTQSGGSISIDSGSFLLATSSNAFYHIVVTYDYPSRTGKMYINGTLVGTGTGNYIPPVGRPLVLDGGVGGVDFLNGYFDEIRWYGRVLSEDEIKDLSSLGHYRRYFFIRDICRSYTHSSSSSLIDALPNCPSGYFNDASTKKVIAKTEWEIDGKAASFELFNYVTNWRNFVFNQTDWSGGANPNGVYSVPSNEYGSKINITTTPFGSFRIENLTQQ